jgi:hypothetical protein
MKAVTPVMSFCDSCHFEGLAAWGWCLSLMMERQVNFSLGAAATREQIQSAVAAVKREVEALSGVISHP